MNLNICFHGIGQVRGEREPGEANYWVRTDTFHGVLDEVAGDARVRLSFDDGNRSDVDTALPALTERGMHATFFVLAGRLDDLASLGADDLRALHAAGMVVGSHGWTHRPWQGLGEAEVMREVHDARELIAAEVGADVNQAALPLGRYDRRALAAAKRAGYRTVFTSDRFPARPNAWLQARYSVTAADTPASIRRLLQRTPGLHEARNLAASAVKRMR